MSDDRPSIDTEDLVCALLNEPWFILAGRKSAWAPDIRGWRSVSLILGLVPFGLTARVNGKSKVLALSASQWARLDALEAVEVKTKEEAIAIYKHRNPS